VRAAGRASQPGEKHFQRKAKKPAPVAYEYYTPANRATAPPEGIAESKYPRMSIVLQAFLMVEELAALSAAPATSRAALPLITGGAVGIGLAAVLTAVPPHSCFAEALPEQYNDGGRGADPGADLPRRIVRRLPPRSTPAMTEPPDEQSTKPASGTPTAPECTTDATRCTTSPPQSGSPPGTSSPEQVGRYCIRRLLGRGGMGTVYLAHDTRLDRDVALKVPHREVAADPLALERFYREARAAAHLHHPNICQIYDVDQADGVHYLTMAFVEGRALSDLVPTFPDRPREAAALVRTLALAVAEAHARGVVHRDLKPANVLIDGRGEPVVMDFGLARRVEVDAALSREGMILGTPAYMSPEQAAGDLAAVGPASDVYSLGVILYELLTGQLPFRGKVTAVLAQVLRDEPPPPSRSRADLDPRLEAVCLQALAKDPARRPAGMLALADLLTAYLDRQGPPPPDVPQTEGPTERFVGEALRLLREWGWARGAERVRALAAPEAPAVAALQAWLGGDAAREAEARRALSGLPQGAAFAAWALVGQGFRAAGRVEFRQAEQCLEQARRAGVADDPVVQANLLHLDGLLLLQQHPSAELVPLLHQALALLGRDHFQTGDVLVTLARVYSYTSNFAAAREFGEQALRCKQAFPRDPSLSQLRQELARLHLDWSELERAQEHLLEALRLAPQGRGDAEQASLRHELGRVALARLGREQGRTRPAALRKLTAEAADHFDLALRLSRQSGSPVLEAWVRQNQALLLLAENRLGEAEEELERAEVVFRAHQVVMGIGEALRTRGLIRRAQSRFNDSEQALRAALVQYEANGRSVEAVRTRLELARTLQAGGASPRQVTQAYLEVLQQAEGLRRADLVAVIDEELRAADEEAYWRHVFRRSRGHGHPEDTAALGKGTSETATVLFLNLHQFVPFSQGLDPEEVMQVLNQMLGDLDAVLERHDAHTTALLGGGFVALLRQAGHAERAVRAGLELLQVVAEFNRPREVLGLRVLPVGVGIASGAVCLGNVGSYRKMDFTAVGMPVNLASRLMREADPAAPCISQETFHLVRDRFRFRPDNPRRVDLKGLGVREVYDVVGRAEDLSSDLPPR
jgi:class 3 adenylate cyclase